MGRLWASRQKRDPKTMAVPRSGNYVVDMYDDALEAQEQQELEDLMDMAEYQLEDR